MNALRVILCVLALQACVFAGQVAKEKITVSYLPLHLLTGTMYGITDVNNKCKTKMVVELYTSDETKSVKREIDEIAGKGVESEHEGAEIDLRVLIIYESKNKTYNVGFGRDRQRIYINGKIVQADRDAYLNYFAPFLTLDLKEYEWFPKSKP